MPVDSVRVVDIRNIVMVNFSSLLFRFLLAKSIEMHTSHRFVDSEILDQCKSFIGSQSDLSQHRCFGSVGKINCLKIRSIVSFLLFE